MTGIKEILEEAIAIEREGRDFYTKSAEKMANAHARAVLEDLAAAETRHIADFKALAEGELDFSRLREDIKSRTSAFEDLVSAFERIERTEDDLTPQLEILEKAKELEKKTSNVYRDWAESTGEAYTKGFLEALAKEEDLHYDLLDATANYLQNPEDFFFEMEGHRLEG